MKKRQYRFLESVLKYMPFVVMVLIITIAILNFRNVTVEGILKFTPDRLYLAVLVFMGLYILKSLSVVIPLALLYLAVGRTFPLPVAVMVNTVGLAIGSTISYLIGHFSGQDLVDSLINRYPKAKRISAIKKENEWIFIFVLRIVNIIPYDIGSIVLGSLKIKYRRFILISVMTKLPGIIAQTFLGATSQNIGSIGFWVSITSTVLITLGYYVIYRWYSGNIAKKSVTA